MGKGWRSVGHQAGRAETISLAYRTGLVEVPDDPYEGLGY